MDFFRELDAPALGRAGHRRAQVLSPPDSSTLPASSTAESRTVGGGADDHILLFFTAADCRAAHRQFQFLMIVVASAVEEAFKVSLRDRVQQRFRGAEIR